MTEKRRRTSEVKEEVANQVSTSEVEVDTLTLDEYLSKVKVNPGLVASFKYEATKDASMLEPKTEDGWKSAFEAQSNKTY
mgnify:FL=1|jgi:hypothetical protein